MKFDLKDFQMAAVAELSQQINSARDEILKTGSLQAVALSSPTGSGKTIILAAIIEKILTGGEAGEARPDSTFLWFSDSPELNAQSLAKVLAATDGFPPERLVTVENTFDQECLLPGYTYFINSQKLGRDKNLTTAGDRNYTFWETVNNTVDKAPGDFYLIVDEAHRGAKTESDFQRATTIVQRFIFGEADVLGPVPMLIGMSATPKRFDELLSRAKRTRRPVEIDPDEVRASGLLKEKIIIAHPAEDETPSDMTLLLEAVRAWKEFGGEWLTYCLAQQIPVVRPILVIQVADGGGSQLTHSPLEAIVRRLEELCSPLSDEELAHCFEVDTTVEVGGRRIRKVEPSRVQDEPFVKFVFFKTSLLTGWDCPRAEVMMSFRRAKEDTLVAQLVGRMVRTPLARKVEANDLLNTVNLYLPYYDGAALKAVLERLKNPDPNNGIAISVSKAEDVVNYPRAVGTEALFERLALLPSYVIDRIPKVSDAKRLIKLARQLNLDKLDRAALEEAKSVLISSLEKSRGHLRASDEFAHQLEKAGTIKVKSLTFRFGSAIPVDDEKTIELALTRENIEDVFERCEKMIAPSEGLHMEYWRRNEQEHGGDQEKIKLELFLLLQDGVAVAELHEAARRKYQALYDRNKHAILALPTSQREAYRRLQGAAKDPRKVPARVSDGHPGR